MNSSRQFDVLVIGGGPAGLAAATCAAECGKRVGLVDDNPSPGGQIWRSAREGVAPPAAQWAHRLKATAGELLCGARVYHQPEPGVLLAETPERELKLSFNKLVLATGARERFLPFPGWTLPNVMGAGGLQALVKSGLPIEGKRVVVAGSGPLLLAVAAYLRQHGANVLLFCEQASLTSLASFGVALFGQPGKIKEGLSFRRELSGVPYCPNSWPVRADGIEQLGSVTISRKGKLATFDCDYLACGFHLVPNTELAVLLGCRLERNCVQVDVLQETSVSGIFCAGEPTGVGGLELALVEGQIAGFAAANRPEQARPLFPLRRKLRKFAQAMDRTFALRSELKNLPRPEDIICRCEDVTFARLCQYTSWRAAKLQTRCGMGPCQGRVCGPIIEFIFDWRPESIRPPVFPARVSSMSALVDRRRPNSQTPVGGN
jgi:NADPH-dependent 2,4-dienoyl-CoA reductase/sulfur reductase-like enzyme